MVDKYGEICRHRPLCWRNLDRTPGVRTVSTRTRTACSSVDRAPGLYPGRRPFESVQAGHFLPYPHSSVRKSGRILVGRPMVRIHLGMPVLAMRTQTRSGHPGSRIASHIETWRSWQRSAFIRRQSQVRFLPSRPDFLRQLSVEQGAL